MPTQTDLEELLKTSSGKVDDAFLLLLQAASAADIDLDALVVAAAANGREEALRVLLQAHGAAPSSWAIRAAVGRARVNTLKVLLQDRRADLTADFGPRIPRQCALLIQMALEGPDLDAFDSLNDEQLDALAQLYDDDREASRKVLEEALRRLNVSAQAQEHYQEYLQDVKEHWPIPLHSLRLIFDPHQPPVAGPPGAAALLPTPMSPVEQAAKYGLSRILGHLLINGDDNVISSKAVDLAAQTDSVACLQLLLERVDPGPLAVGKAALRGNVGILKTLLQDPRTPKPTTVFGLSSEIKALTGMAKNYKGADMGAFIDLGHLRDRELDAFAELFEDGRLIATLIFREQSRRLRVSQEMRESPFLQSFLTVLSTRLPLKMARLRHVVSVYAYMLAHRMRSGLTGEQMTWLALDLLTNPDTASIIYRYL